MGLVLLSALACQGLDAQQTFYKWKDASGTVHYGDAPPPSGKASTLNVKVTGDADAQQTVQTHNAAAKNANATMDRQALEKADAQYRSVACKSARDDANLATGKQMLVAGKDAESARKLSDEDRARAELDAKSKIAELCKDGGGQ
jgi:hypothetical protein